jgi:dTDP-4-dehydrorhamnose 3,5-epimerase
MTFTEIPLNGAYLVDLDRRGDERGFFARVFDAEEFAVQGLVTRFAQINTSCSAKAGTTRGLHFQVAPHGEAKLVKCLRGAIFDVIVDLRRSSDTYGHWFGTELNDQNRRMLYVPVGFAHGFMTLQDNTEIMYPSSSPYAPDAERILAWDDVNVGIKWPLEPTVLSEKDKNGAPLAAIGPYTGY